jgi:hypothetical protein
MSLNDGLAGWLAGLERGVITVAKRSLASSVSRGTQARSAARRSIRQQEQSTAAACDRQALQQSALTASRAAKSVQLRTDSFLIHRTRPALEPGCALGFFWFWRPRPARVRRVGVRKQSISAKEPVNQSADFGPVADFSQAERRFARFRWLGFGRVRCRAGKRACVADCILLVRLRVHTHWASKRRIGAPEPQRPSVLLLLLLPYCCCDCCF